LENKKIYFKEEQIFFISLIPALIIIFTLTVLYFFEIGDEEKKITLIPYIFGISIFMFIILLTYNLKIIVDNNFIRLSFGIGIIKKKIPLNDINLDEIKVINIPWYYGIGMRFTKLGTIFNTKQGKGIHLKLKNNQKSFIIVLNKINELKKILLNNKQRTYGNNV
jgi:hypothetical protein